MNFCTLRKTLVLVCWVVIAVSSTWAQFKKVYTPDTLVLELPNFFNATKLVETDIPGKQISVVGSMYTNDSAGLARATMFNLLCNLDGVPQDMHLFEDTSVFSFQGPRAFAACYDGNGVFYLGTGANSKQVILKSDAAGNLLWSQAGHHHEYYSMICEGGSVTFLGQDESIQGAHDFSLASLDASGSDGAGTMFGTPNFESPHKVAKINNEYVMVGESYQTNSFDGMIVKANANFEQVWGKGIHVPGKSLLMFGIDQPHDGRGYIISGKARGGADSLFLMKMDTAGNPLWMKLYGIAGTAEAYNTALAVDPASGGYLLSGSYHGTQWQRPYIFMTDSTGAVQWARDYGDPGVNSDETLNDLIYCQADGMFYAVGDMVEIDSNQYLHKILMVKIAADSGSVPCDSAIAVGSATAVAQALGTTNTEPFVANTHFPIGNLIHANMTPETRCLVIVGLADHLPKLGTFQIVNPSGPTLHVKAEVQSGGATLRVTGLNGQVVLETALAEGLLDQSFALPQLSDGLYLVSMAGGEWRYPTLRWMVAR